TLGKPPDEDLRAERIGRTALLRHITHPCARAVLRDPRAPHSLDASLCSRRSRLPAHPGPTSVTDGVLAALEKEDRRFARRRHRESNFRSRRRLRESFIDEEGRLGAPAARAFARAPSGRAP